VTRKPRHADRDGAFTAARPSGRGRYLWARGGDRLFDPAGVEYRGAYTDLTRAEVERCLGEAGTPIAVIECGEGVTFTYGAARTAVWREHVRPAFVDLAEGQGAEGQAADEQGGELPYRAEVWQRVSGSTQVLVFRND
jgi:hypothetical protein